MRVGASYDLFGTGRTLLRGAFGTFYDRPFRQSLGECAQQQPHPAAAGASGRPHELPGAGLERVGNVSGQSSGEQFPGSDAGGSEPRATATRQSYFAGVQQRITDNLTLEVNGLGTYGRDLITTDIVNRDFSTPPAATIRTCRTSRTAPTRAFSDYNALTAVVRYRISRGMVQAPTPGATSSTIKAIR